VNRLSSCLSVRCADPVSRDVLCQHGDAGVLSGRRSLPAPAPGTVTAARARACQSPECVHGTPLHLIARIGAGFAASAEPDMAPAHFRSWLGHLHHECWHGREQARPSKTAAACNGSGRFVARGFSVARKNRVRLHYSHFSA
jgi:hypothetical protein